MEIEIKADASPLEDGKHFGMITAVEYREVNYHGKTIYYTDVIVECEGRTLKTGYPTNITISSRLGKLLLDFGAVLEVGKSINPASVLVGKACKFMTMTKGKYTDIVKDSLKPNEETVQ